MHARMKHPAFVLPDAFKALQALRKSTEDAGISEVTRELVELRASQINGCGVCVPMHSAALNKSGQSDERIFSVAAWRDTPYFTDAERAALALAEFDDAARRRERSGAGRRVERGGEALRREGAVGADRVDLRHQCVEPVECDRAAGCGGQVELSDGWRQAATLVAVALTVSVLKPRFFVAGLRDDPASAS